jgi:hypothetical protein
MEPGQLLALVLLFGLPLGLLVAGGLWAIHEIRSRRGPPGPDPS